MSALRRESDGVGDESGCEKMVRMYGAGPVAWPAAVSEDLVLMG